MATSIIKYDGDTAWEHGTTSATTNIYYRRKNGFVTITAQISGEVTLDNTTTTLINLGTEYAPSASVFFGITNRGSATQGAFGHVTTSGAVLARSPLGSMAYLNFSVTYPVK